ncbi:MAG: hypothetical protein HYT80_08500 [Euryarchaeota archaeon]|nr:hypothetical protein [Euryarchaeota archaeon]
MSEPTLDATAERRIDDYVAQAADESVLEGPARREASRELRAHVHDAAVGFANDEGAARATQEHVERAIASLAGRVQAAFFSTPASRVPLRGSRAWKRAVALAGSGVVLFVAWILGAILSQFVPYDDGQASPAEPEDPQAIPVPVASPGPAGFAEVLVPSALVALGGFLSAWIRKGWITWSLGAFLLVVPAFASLSLGAGNLPVLLANTFAICLLVAWFALTLVGAPPSSSVRWYQKPATIWGTGVSLAVIGATQAFYASAGLFLGFIVVLGVLFTAAGRLLGGLNSFPRSAPQPA